MSTILALLNKMWNLLVSMVKILLDIQKSLNDLAAGQQLIQANQQTILANQQAADIQLKAVIATQLDQSKTLNAILTAVVLPPAVSSEMTFEFDGVTKTGANLTMKVPMNTAGIIASVAFKNAAGGPGVVDGIPTWSADPPSAVTLAPAADGLTCQITTNPITDGIPVNCVIKNDADGDLGEGTTDIASSGLLVIFDPASAAVASEVTFTLPAPPTP